jgi:ribonuclease J
VTPEVIARGFPDPEAVLEDARAEAERVLRRCLSEHVEELKLVQEHLHDAIGQLVHERTGRRPMILPIVLEI